MAAPSVSQTFEQIAQPFSSMPASNSSTQAPATEWTLWVISIVWLMGFVTILFTRLQIWRHIRAVIRTSTPMKISNTEIPAAIAVRSSGGLLEPGVVGWLRPVLVLPADIQERLTPVQLNAVLTHELCHVQRRDNLTSAIHMIVEAIFWFHPFVWWIGARLVDERERACDEEVLRSGGNAQVYAQGILNVCKMYHESPLRCVAGVTGSDIKKRIESILANPRSYKLNFRRKLLLATAGVAALSVPIVIGSLNARPAQTQSSEFPAQFEVASIRLIPPGTLIRAQALGIACHGSDGVRQTTTAVKPQVDPVIVTPQGRCSANGVSLQTLIGFAYGIPTSYVSGGPDWIRNVGRIGMEPDGFSFREAEAFHVEATADEPATVTVKQLRQMLQKMLADRFDLKVHREANDIKGYALVVAEHGPKLKEVSNGFESPRAIYDDRLQRMIQGTSGLNDLAALLLPGLPVADKTGLMGVYEYKFLAPLPPPPPPPPPGASVVGPSAPGGNGGFQPVSDTAHDLSALLEDQLGLRLKADTISVETLVIDHIERPSPN
jgi:uncharacterized protein (TIGR03435 family)